MVQSLSEEVNMEVKKLTGTGAPRGSLLTSLLFLRTSDRSSWYVFKSQLIKNKTKQTNKQINPKIVASNALVSLEKIQIFSSFIEHKF